MTREGDTLTCPFCNYIQSEAPIARRDTFFAKYDRYPVSRGHVLLIPVRHVASVFELTPQEAADCFRLLLEVRSILQEAFSPDGYSIGINEGHAGGQTVMHLHVHVIPRYGGDVPRPEGGIRRILPNLVEYPPQANAE